VVHGRAGGRIPEELESLAAELSHRRGASVLLQALTGQPPPASPAVPAGTPLTLVPLFLLPGAHVRRDVPAIAADWRRTDKVRQLPFLGAWPAWQRTLAAEAAALTLSSGRPPRLLHHPLQGDLARRYLAHLERVIGAPCLATPYSSADPHPNVLALPGPVLPLTLANSRLTEGGGEQLGPPLLARPGCRAALLDLLEALP
jgi:sirohydrochlorin ferrochelatase